MDHQPVRARVQCRELMRLPCERGGEPDASACRLVGVPQSLGSRATRVMSLRHNPWQWRECIMLPTPLGTSNIVNASLGQKLIAQHRSAGLARARFRMTTRERLSSISNRILLWLHRVVEFPSSRSTTCRYCVITITPGERS